MSGKVFSIFLIVAGLFLFLVAQATGIKQPDIDNLDIATGKITYIDYKMPRGGSTSMSIQLNNNPKEYFLRDVSEMDIYNGCNINSINYSDSIKIFYDANGYNDAIGEQNAIWIIDKNNINIVDIDSVIKASKSSNNNKKDLALILFFAGLFLNLIFLIFPEFETIFEKK